MNRLAGIRRILLGGAFVLGLLGVGGSALAQQCTLTETDDPNTFAGGTGAISATLGSGTVTVQVPGGLGLLSLTTTASVNAVVTIPPYTTGTTGQVVVTYTTTNPALAASFTLNAQTQYHGVNITVNCAATPPPPSACVLTQGYWKNHPSEWPVTTLTLGSVAYTQSQLLAILSQPVKGNGLVSLAHQLIAAKLNLADGATAPGSVQQAIAAADLAIGNRVVPPGGTGSLSTSSVSGLVSILDAFNSGTSPGGPAHCAEDTSSGS